MSGHIHICPTYQAENLCKSLVEPPEPSSHPVFGLFPPQPDKEIWFTASHISKLSNHICKSFRYNKHTESILGLESKVLPTFVQFVPATRHATSPPSLLAAVMALSVIGVSLSLLCSATTKVLWNLWRTPACWRHLTKIEKTIVIKKDKSCYVCFHVSPLTFIFTGIIIPTVESRSKCSSYYNPNTGLTRKHTHMLICSYFNLIYFLTPLS